VRRSKVGSTHEDVDGLFSVIKAHIKNKEIMTPDEMVAAIKSAFSNYSLPVFVVIVDATYDYKAHYKGHVDKKLGGYGYSADTDGYHCLQFDDSKTVRASRVSRSKSTSRTTMSTWPCSEKTCLRASDRRMTRTSSCDR